MPHSNVGAHQCGGVCAGSGGGVHSNLFEHGVWRVRGLPFVRHQRLQLLLQTRSGRGDGVQSGLALPDLGHDLGHLIGRNHRSHDLQEAMHAHPTHVVINLQVATTASENTLLLAR